MQLTYQLEERLPGVACYYAAHPSDSGPLVVVFVSRSSR